MRTISRINKTKLNILETAESVELAIRTPDTDKKINKLLQKISQNCNEPKNKIRQYIYKMALDDSYTCTNYGVNFYDVDRIHKEAKEYAATMGYRFAFKFPIKKSRIAVISDGRVRPDRASRITILTMIALGFLITDERKGYCNGIKTRQIANMIGCSCQSVQRALQWLEKHELIYSPDTYEYNGIFSVYIIDGEYTDNGLYRKAAQGGHGYTSFSYELFEELCNMTSPELRIALIALDISSRNGNAENTISLKEYKDMLPGYITNKTLNDNLNKIKLNNILSIVADRSDGYDEYFIITEKPENLAGEVSAVQRYANRHKEPIMEFIETWCAIYGLKKENLRLNHFGSEYSERIGMNIGDVSYFCDDERQKDIKPLILTRELESVFVSCAEFNDQTVHSALKYICKIYKRHHTEHLKNDIYRYKLPYRRFHAEKAAINNLGAYIRKVCELVSGNVIHMNEFHDLDKMFINNISQDIA